MTSILVQVLQSAITTLAGAAFIGLAGIIGIYFNKLTGHIKRKELISTIENYVLWAEQKPSFKTKTNEEKYMLVFEKGMSAAIDIGISVSEGEMDIMVESAVKKMKQREIREMGE